MIFKSYWKVSRSLPQRLKNDLEAKGFSKQEIDKISEVILGDWNNDYYSEYRLEDYIEDNSDMKWWHRLNMCWIFPLLLIASPITYIIKGDYRLHPNSKVGKIVNKLIGAKQ